nr:tetratricopeptide repeat protein [Acanthopleuribacter pedis]
MGLSEADLQQASQTAREHRERATTFRVHGRHQDALDELKRAAPFLPNDLALHLDMARCYLALGDTKKAEHWARYCLQLDHRCDEAIQLLNRIDTLEQQNDTWDKHSRRSAVSAFFGAMGAVVILVAIILLVVLRAGKSEEAPQPTPLPAKQAPSQAATTTSLPGFTQSHRDIPIKLVGGQNLVLERTRSRLTTFNDQSFYKMATILRNTGTEDFVDIRGYVVLKNEAGVVVKRQGLSPFRKSRGKHMIPDEKIGAGTTIIADESVTQAEWVLEVADSQPHTALHEAEPVQVQWSIKQPSGAKLRVNQRTIGGMDMRQGRQSLQIALDFTNNGSSPYNRLKFEIDILDAEGTLLLSRPGYVITDQTPPLLGGESRAFHGVYVYTGQRAGYNLRIVQLE